MKNVSIFIFLSLILSTGFTLAYGVVDDFSTDQSIYHKNDELQISGNVQYDPNIQFVTVQIFTPGKSGFADFKTFPVSSDGMFSTTFHVGGPTWATDGHYSIKVTYDGNMEKTIQYKEFTDKPPNSEPEADAEPNSEPEADAEPNSEPEADAEPNSEPEADAEPNSEPEADAEPNSEPETSFISEPASNFITLKFKIPNFPALDKSPQYYIDRYDNEQSYKSWFDSQFPNDSIDDVVGYEPTKVPGFPALDKSPQYYIDRYDNEQSYKSWFDSQFPNDSIDDVVGYEPTKVPGFPALDKSPQYYIDRYDNEQSYKSWFDSQFPNDSIHNILGYENPVSVPDWIRSNAEWWAIGEINDSTFVSGIEFMLKNNIIRVSNISPSENISEEDIPPWIRNSAHWWSQDLISEDEFINALKYLIQQGIITVN